jgi:hypothetical protein
LGAYHGSSTVELSVVTVLAPRHFWLAPSQRQWRLLSEESLRLCGATAVLGGHSSSRLSVCAVTLRHCVG